MTVSRYFRRPMLAGALIIMSLVAIGLSFANTPADTTTAIAPKAALTVSTVTPELVEWPVQLTANGNIAAWQEAIISAEASGLRLTDVLVNVGEPVHKGQLLARLQSDSVEAELALSKASLAEAEATLTEARANADRARKIDASGALSAQQSVQYLTGELTAKARVDAAKARLKSDQIRLKQTQILAPDDGTVSASSATLGAVVQTGQELFRLIRRNRLEWRAELPASQLTQIHPGMRASITTSGNNPIHGKVRIVAPTVETHTRNGLVYVDLPGNTDARPGMFARGEIDIARSNELTLPQRAMLLRDGFSYVFLLDKDNRVIQTKVTTGPRSGELIAITAGLEAGAQVVDSGVGFLADGDLVRIVPAVSTH